MLEDLGYVSSSERDGKKIYTITTEGKKFLAERQEEVEKIKAHMKEWRGPHQHGDFHQSVNELRDMWRLHRTVTPDSEKWGRIKEVIARAHKEIEDIVEKG